LQTVSSSSTDNTSMTLDDDHIVDMCMPKLGRAISYIHPEMQKTYEQQYLELKKKVSFVSTNSSSLSDESLSK